MKKAILWIAIIALLPCLVSAKQFAKSGTAGVQFLKLGVDARAIGMGEAYVAVADDISSVHWNPAGLSLKEENQLLISHTNWVADIMHEYVAVSYVDDELGTFALSGSFLHMPDMDETTEEFFGKTGRKFGAGDIAIGLTYSSMLTEQFSYGVTARYIHEELEEEKVDGMSVDIGTLYNTGFKNITIGMAVRNFGPELKYELDDDGDGSVDEDPYDLIDNDGDGLTDEDREEVEFKLPMCFSLGIAGDIFREDDTSLIVSAQLESYVDRQETWNVGGEYQVGPFAIRSGYMINGEDVAGGYTGGFGFKIPADFAIIHLDYAYTNMEDLEESFAKSAHRLSIKLMY